MSEYVDLGSKPTSKAIKSSVRSGATYATIGLKIGDFMPHASYSWYRYKVEMESSTFNPITRSVATVTTVSKRAQHGVTLGTTYNISPSVVYKLEFSHVKNRYANQFGLVSARLFPGKRANLLSTSFDLVF